MPHRSAQLFRTVLLIALAVALPSCAKTAHQESAVTAATPGAIAISFGRCAPEACPRPADPQAAGDAAFQQTFLECFSKELERPVYALADAPAPAAGYWLDVSVAKRSQASDGPIITVDFRLYKGAGNQLQGFAYTMSDKRTSFPQMCEHYSKEARSRLQ